jgi:O-antigen/teichoic acid export membrane protein
MVANAIKMLVGSISGAITPFLGNLLAVGSEKDKNDAFDFYEFSMNQITIFAFVCGALLVTPFISIYTRGIEDANYYRPVFGYLIMIAEAAYCFREPYVNAAYVSGKFKETAKYAYIEAGINIAVSVMLVSKYGAAGVAVGTLISMVYRYVAHVFYLKKNILDRAIVKWLSSILNICALSLFSVLIWIILLNKPVYSYYEWFINAFMTACFVLLLIITYSMIFKRKIATQLLHKIIRKK